MKRKPEWSPVEAVSGLRSQAVPGWYFCHSLLEAQPFPTPTYLTVHPEKQFSAQMKISFLSIAFPYSLALGTHPRQDQALMTCSAVLPGGAGGMWEARAQTVVTTFVLCQVPDPSTTLGSQPQGPSPCRPGSLRTLLLGSPLIDPSQPEGQKELGS